MQNLHLSIQPWSIDTFSVWLEARTNQIHPYTNIPHSTSYWSGRLCALNDCYKKTIGDSMDTDPDGEHKTTVATDLADEHAWITRYKEKQLGKIHRSILRALHDGEWDFVLYILGTLDGLQDVLQKLETGTVESDVDIEKEEQTNIADIDAYPRYYSEYVESFIANIQPINTSQIHKELYERFIYFNTIKNDLYDHIAKNIGEILTSMQTAFGFIGGTRVQMHTIGEWIEKSQKQFDQYSKAKNPQDTFKYAIKSCALAEIYYRCAGISLPFDDRQSIPTPLDYFVAMEPYINLNIIKELKTHIRYSPSANYDDHVDTRERVLFSGVTGREEQELADIKGTILSVNSLSHWVVEFDEPIDYLNETWTGALVRWVKPIGFAPILDKATSYRVNLLPLTEKELPSNDTLSMLKNAGWPARQRWEDEFYASANQEYDIDDRWLGAEMNLI